MQMNLFLIVVIVPVLLMLGSSWLAAQVGIDPGGDWPGGWWQNVLFWFSSRTGSWVRMLLEGFITPGEWIADRPWSAMTGNQALLAGLFSYAVWMTVIPGGLKLVGLWDWFGYGSRRRSVTEELNVWWVWLRDWFEEMTSFGKGPTSKWARMADMKGRRWRRGDVFLGRPWTKFGGRSWPVGLSTEKHMVTIAGTGSGKSTAALIPNLCLHQGSVLCIDPKGELARITAGQRSKRRGGIPHPVYVLDPFGIAGSGATDGYNPFDEMEWAAIKNPDRAVSYAARISEALVKPMSTTDSYWDKAAKTLLTGLVLYIFVHEPKERKNLIRLRELVTEGDLEGYEAAVAAGVFAREELNPFDFLIEKMKSVRKELHGEAIARAAGTIAMMGEGQRGSVLTTAQEHLAFVDNTWCAAWRKDTRSRV